MNTVLLIVTILSLAAAVILAVFNWRLISAERRRSAARVDALLSAAAAAPEPASVRAPLEAPAASFALRPTPVEHQDLFHTTAEPPSSPWRVAIPAALGVVAIGTLMTVFLLSNDGGKETAPAGVAAVRTAGTTSAPLELLSLRHELADDRLSITGLVRNPRTSRQLSGVNVVVFVFNRNGAFLTSLQGPLDFRTLAAGDESPFVVSLDHVADVGRYRVSFRAENQVVPHVDRRQAPVVASVSRQ
jgi:hypothetical protein